MVYRSFKITTKKVHTIYEIFTKRKLATIIMLAGGWTLWIRDLRNCHNSFLLKTIIWTWISISFQVLQSTLLKNEKNIKRDESYLNIARDRRRTLKKRTKNEKWEKVNNYKYFLLLLFYTEKFIFCFKTYLEKLCLYRYSFFTWQWSVVSTHCFS